MPTQHGTQKLKNPYRGAGFPHRLRTISPPLWNFGTPDKVAMAQTATPRPGDRRWRGEPRSLARYAGCTGMRFDSSVVLKKEGNGEEWRSRSISGKIGAVLLGDGKRHAVKEGMFDIGSYEFREGNRLVLGEGGAGISKTSATWDDPQAASWAVLRNSVFPAWIVPLPSHDHLLLSGLR
ncbi:MAG: hypothetical protein EWM72_00663 [Nitrospira sp.]|nr:MAG: hypothetical protein EWM72_00663 [Nitrospira sp.]